MSHLRRVVSHEVTIFESSDRPMGTGKGIYGEALSWHGGLGSKNPVGIHSIVSLLPVRTSFADLSYLSIREIGVLGVTAMP